MENRNQNEHADETVRHPQPDAASRDPRAAAVQDQVHADSEANREAAARARESTPNEVSEKTVAEIADAAEWRARG
jgi:hypothetical protein